MKKLFSFLSILYIILAATPVTSAHAQNSVSCLNPSGTISADYPTGTHGIIGNTTSYTGHDTVYTLSDGNTMQCLCIDNGQGVQTNWQNASQLSEDQIKVLESQGWIYVPSGASWGLDDIPYLAQNIDYNCRPTDNNGGSSSNNSSSSSSNNSSSNNGQVLGASTTNVLALANTGNILFIYTVFAVWAVSSLLAILLRRKSK